MVNLLSAGIRFVPEDSYHFRGDGAEVFLVTRPPSTFNQSDLLVRSARRSPGASHEAQPGCEGRPQQCCAVRDRHMVAWRGKWRAGKPIRPGNQSHSLRSRY